MKEKGVLEMMHNWNLLNRGGMGTMMWMGLFWIILLIVVVYLAVKLFSDKTNHSDKMDNKAEKDSPLDILQKEFAKGNITEEEYLKKRKYLE